jgi:hypothetical protein
VLAVGAVAVRLQLSTLRQLAFSRWGVTFAVTAAAGIAMRVWLYGSTLEIPNSDEAVLGLMARHALHGEFTTFFWGQSYGGSQEALLTVPVFWIFGSSWLALRIVPIALNAVAALLVWRVGLRTIGRPAAAVAGSLYWIWPPFLVFQLVRQQAFYGSNIVYCGLILLLALRVVERPDRLRVGLFGLVLGLAFWQTSQIVPIALPVIAWTIWKQPRCLRHLWLAAVLALVGALPWIVYNVGHDWASLTLPYGDKPYLHRLRVFVSPLLAMTLGLRSPFSAQRLLPGLLTYLIYAVLLVLFIVGAIRTRRRTVSILYAAAAVFPFLYAISPLTSNSAEPRYVLVVTPVLTLLVAQVATSYPRALAVLAAGAALSVVTFQRMDDAVRANPQVWSLAPRNLGPLIATLDRLQLDHVYTTYWLAYRLDFETGERIVAVKNKFIRVSFRNGRAVLPHDPYVRYAPYEREVAASRHGFVFLRQTLSTIPIVRQLERHGYRRVTVSRFVIFAPP